MDGSVTTVLLVEDEEAHAELIRRAFEVANSGVQITVAGSLAAAREAIAVSAPSLALVDFRLPDGSGLDAMEFEGANEFFPVVVMTSYGDEALATDAMRAGALDYVVKSDVTMSGMPEIVGRALLEWGRIVETKQSQERLAEQSHKLQKRVKELSCLYGLARLVETPGISLDGILQGTADLIPPSWQYPEITCARLTLCGREFLTEGCGRCEHRWRQSADILVCGKAEGSIVVCYGEERPEADEGPFLSEERELLDALAERLGRVIEHREADRLLARTQLAVDRAATLVFWIKRDGGFDDVNAAACQKLGYTREELCAMSVADIDPFFPLQGWASHWAEVKSQGFTQFESAHRRKDGEEFPVQVITHHVVFGDEEFLFCTAEDLTARKLAEEGLQHQYQISQTFLDAFPCVALVLRPETREVVMGNKAARDVGAVPGTTCYGTWGQRETPCPFCVAPDVWATGTHHQAEVEYGGVLWDAHWVPIDDSQYLHFAFDITERRKLDERSQRAQQLGTLGTMAGGIAHDFNNVLGVMLGYAELAQFDVPPGGNAHTCIGEVLTAGERARDLVMQILSFSRQAGSELAPTKIQPLLAESVRFLRATLPTTIQITVDLDQDCGDVVADPTQIHQAVMNLCVNALHAMKDTGGVLRIALSPSSLGEDEARELGGVSPGQYACIRVSDTGCGMDSETRERMFDPFFTTRPVGEGTGLGLASVHEIVSRHGGTITVESEVGVGTSVSVYLPLSASTAAVESGTLDAVVGGDERLLVVDDESALCEIAKEMLSSLGYEVTAMANSLGALAALRTHPQDFDLLLTDQMMPGLTGLALATAARQARPGLPVVLVTGYSKQVSPEHIQAAGVSEVLMKPYNKRQLAEAVRRALDVEQQKEQTPHD